MTPKKPLMLRAPSFGRWVVATNTLLACGANSWLKLSSGRPNALITSPVPVRRGTPVPISARSAYRAVGRTRVDRRVRRLSPGPRPYRHRCPLRDLLGRCRDADPRIRPSCTQSRSAGEAGAVACRPFGVPPGADANRQRKAHRMERSYRKDGLSRIHHNPVREYPGPRTRLARPDAPLRSRTKPGASTREALSRRSDRQLSRPPDDESSRELRRHGVSA